MLTADGDAPRDVVRAATKRRRQLSERERQALRAATARASGGRATAVPIQPAVALPYDELAAAWASADSAPATRMVAMMTQPNSYESTAPPEIEVGEPRAAAVGATADVAVPTSGDSAVIEVAVPESPSASGDLEPTVETVGPTSTAELGGHEPAASVPGELASDGSCGTEPALPAEAPGAAGSELLACTEERGCGETGDRMPGASVPIAPGVGSDVGAGPSSEVSHLVDGAAEPPGSADAMAPPTAGSASEAVAPDHASAAPNDSVESTVASTNAGVPAPEPEPSAAESVAVPTEIFAFAEIVEPGVARLADPPGTLATDSPGRESTVDLSAAQVEASRSAAASAAEDVAAMAAIVAAANTDAPTVHEVSLEALEDTLTVDESAPPPNHGALTISEAELSALAEPAAEKLVATVDDGAAPELDLLESITAASAARFAEPVSANSTEHQTPSVTASELEALEAVLGAKPAEGADAATTGTGDLNPTVLAELTRVQDALRDVLDAAPTASQSSAEIHVLRSQLEGLAAEVQSLRVPPPVELPRTPRQHVVIAAEHLLLVGGGFAMLAWSLASLFSGNQTKLTLLGVIAANLAFAAAILRSGRGK